MVQDAVPRPFKQKHRLFNTSLALKCRIYVVKCLTCYVYIRFDFLESSVDINQCIDRAPGVCTGEPNKGRDLAFY